MRKFLALSLILLITLINGCKNPKTEHYERSEKVMGTIVTLKADGVNAKAAVDESFDKIFELVENIKGDLKRIESTNEYVKINPDVYEILKISQHYSEQTNGAFDVTIGAAVNLWKNARKNNQLPTTEDIENVKKFVGFDHLHLRESDNSAMIDTQGVNINLGGVGKGYGVDIVRKIFIKHGIKDGLIDFGTSTIYAFGKKRIGLKNPHGNELSEIIELKNSAISTSGDYEQYFIINGQRYHHIIDPKTCMPTDNGITSVSVSVNGNIENCATIADILSTSIFILGEKQSEELLTPKNYNIIHIFLTK